MGQEYFIAIQPKPKYQLWALKKIIKAWYADEELSKNIRKVKILINQFRADPEKEHNKKNGIYPSILIYPRYGLEAMKSVFSQIILYFSMYHDDSSVTRFDDLQWENSQPEYFLKQNSLIYYTNGLSDLKKYVQKSIESSGTEIKNDIFDENYSEFKKSGRVLSM